MAYAETTKISLWQSMAEIISMVRKARAAIAKATGAA